MLNGGVSQFAPKCPVLSRFVLFCPSWGPGTVTKEDKRGQNGTFRDKLGNAPIWHLPPFSSPQNSIRNPFVSREWSKRGSEGPIRKKWVTRATRMDSRELARMIGANRPTKGLASGLPNANAKSQRFSYAISRIAPLPLMVALNRSSESQIATRYAAFWHTNLPNRISLFPLVPPNRSVLNRNAFFWGGGDFSYYAMRLAIVFQTSAHGKIIPLHPTLPPN